MRKVILSIFIIILTLQSLKGQVLNLVFHSEVECGLWCWASTCRNIICYYGYDNLTNCEVAEYTRSINPVTFGSIDCCQSVSDGCCKTNPLGEPGGMVDIFNHWGLNTNYTYSPLLKSEIITELLNNRPFVIRFPGHVVVGYGINGNDIYIRDPGWGYEIRDYNVLIFGTGNKDRWTETIRITNSPIVCDYYRSLTGTITNDGIYKASGNYDVSCSISNNASISIKAPNSITMDSGFSIELGSSLDIQTGNVNINCP